MKAAGLHIPPPAMEKEKQSRCSHQHYFLSRNLSILSRMPEAGGPSPPCELSSHTLGCSIQWEKAWISHPLKAYLSNVAQVCDGRLWTQIGLCFHPGLATCGLGQISLSFNCPLENRDNSSTAQAGSECPMKEYIQRPCTEQMLNPSLLPYPSLGL